MCPNHQPNQPLQRARRWRPLFLAGVVLLVAWLSWSPASPEPLTLRFLYYTNNYSRQRIAMLEITNHTESPYVWRLRTESKGVNHGIGITDLMETNGALRPVGPFDGSNL